MKLAVGTPWSSPFMFTDYVDATLNMKHPKDYEVKFFRGSGWCPARRHINLCEKALEWGADLICIIGADQIHPTDMLEKLVGRFEEGYEVISALVPCRGYVHWQPMKPFQPMAWRFKSSKVSIMKKYEGMKITPEMVHVIDPKDGDMQEVNFIGSGVLMFHRDHLLALKKPWFKETINPEDQQRIANMDCIFVWRLQDEAHAKVWVDTTIKVKHAHVFKIDDTFQDRFEDWAIKNDEAEICPDKETIIPKSREEDVA